MASCPAPGGNCRGCMNELATLAWYVKVNPSIMPDRKTIMPQPEWCQEAAMIGFLLDGLRGAEPASSE